MNERLTGSRKPEACHRGAFTFVELLVVVTIFAILSLGVYATFVSGMRMWGRIQDTTFIQRKTILRLEKIAQDLRQTLDFPKIGFSGTISQISFPILSANDEILKVSYLLDNESLFRKQESFKDILAKKEVVKKRALLSGIKDLKFSFGYKEVDKDQYSWKDTWNKEEGSPIMVKIELKTEDANFTKTITIPIS